MTLEVPLFSQGGVYSARVTRGLLANLLTEGVLSGFAVSQRGAGANFSVDVTLGQAVVEGDDETNQGNYLCVSTATENVVVSAAPGSNSRYDIVVLQVNDPTAGGSAGDDFTIEVIAGTASGSPTPPAVPDSALLIATIGPIATATASITNSLIADSRTYATLAHDVVDDSQASRLGTNTLVNGSLVRRSTGTGQISVGTPTASDSAATKGYVDGLFPVGSSQIADGAIILTKLGTNSVSTSKINDGNVTTAKLADGAVTNAKLTTAPGSSSGSVRWRKLGDMVTVYIGASGNVTSVNIPSGYRPSENIRGSGTNAVGTYRIRVTTGGDLEYLDGTWQAMIGDWTFSAFQYPAA